MPRIPSWTGVKVATLLQYAAQTGQEEVIEWLLNVGHADPTVAVPSGAAVTGQDPLDGDQENDQNNTRAAPDGLRPRSVPRCA